MSDDTRAQLEKGRAALLASESDRELGMKAAARARKATAKTAMTSTSGRGAAAFQTGVQALAQYLEREGGGMPGRGHVELLPDGVEHRTGVWIANQKTRRDRLDEAQLDALADLGVHWASP